jgi:hypothetical protein
LHSQRVFLAKKQEGCPAYITAFSRPDFLETALLDGFLRTFGK